MDDNDDEQASGGDIGSISRDSSRAINRWMIESGAPP